MNLRAISFKKLQKIAHPLLGFGLALGFFLVIFIIKSVFPFGDRSFMFMDMYHQYVPFMQELWEKLQGEEQVFYSYQLGLGSDFLALYIYYLACPLHFLVALLPKEYVIEFTTYMCVFKLCACTFTATYYFQEHFKAKGYEKIWFGLLYSTCGFMCAFNWNIMWLDACVMFPLVLLGLEKMLKEGKCALYCISLAATIYLNYYIAIMICIFMVIYFVVLTLLDGLSWRKIWQFALFSLLAGGMASVLLIPEVCAILQTDFGSATFPKEFKSYFTIFDVLSRHCVDVTCERGLNHWPNIYTGALTFLMIPMYLCNKEIPLKKRFAMFAVLGFFLLSFSTNVLEFLWHGMNYPDSLPARQSFIYCFLVLVMCYEAYLHMEVTDRKILIGSYVGSVVFLILCEKLVEDERYTRDQMLLTLLFVTLYAVILYVYKYHKVTLIRRCLSIVLTLVIVVETGINTYDVSTGTTSRDAYLENQSDYQVLYERTREKLGEETFFRMEKITKKTKNDGILGGYPSASIFSSTMNSKVSDLYEKLGMRYSKVFYSFDGATPLTAALLNVNYLFKTEIETLDEKGDLNAVIGGEENEILKLVDRSGNISLYEFAYHLPFGYVLPYECALPTGGYALSMQNKLVHSLGIVDDLFVRVDTKSSQDNVTLNARSKGIYYMVMGSTGFKKIDADGAYERNYVDLKKKSVLYVGSLAKGESVVFTNAGDDTGKSFNLDAYYLDLEVLEEVFEVLNQNQLENVIFDETHIQGNLSLSEPGRLVLSIPYEEGWTVKVNGEKVIPKQFGGCLIALDLESGDYDISMEFAPKGLKEGVLVSVVSVILFVGIMLLMKRKKGYPRRG